MGFNVDKAKKLVTVFSKLDEESQDALLLKALEMETEQSFKNKLKQSNKEETEENLKDLRREFLAHVPALMKQLDGMEPNQFAAFAIVLNEMTNGKLAKEEYIDFVVSSRQLSISEYIEKYIPGADFEEAKKLYQEIKANSYSL